MEVAYDPLSPFAQQQCPISSLFVQLPISISQATQNPFEQAGVHRVKGAFLTEAFEQRVSRHTIVARDYRQHLMHEGR